MRMPFFRLGAALCVAAHLGCSDSHSADGSAKKDPFANASSGGGGSSSTSGQAGSDDFETTPVHDDDGKLVPTTLPSFPGAGTSDASVPLPNGMLCDAVPLEQSPIPERVETCYFDKNDPSTGPAATLEQVLECADEVDTVHLRLTFHPWFVDNSYGANAIGWDHSDTTTTTTTTTMPMMMAMKMPKAPRAGHTFKDLVGSDHAELILHDKNDQNVMQFKLDYISIDESRPSGYGALGVLGGEGKVILGNPQHVVRWSTSEDRNLNERGYASYTVDSPATDENYTPNPDTPEWDYRVVYEAWIDIAAFGDAGFGGATIEYVHASPSKTASNTIDVMPGKCPPCTDPDGCHGNPPPPPPPPPPPGSCGSNDPDEVCADAGPPTNGGMPLDCKANPEQCMVD